MHRTCVLVIRYYVRPARDRSSSGGYDEAGLALGAFHYAFNSKDDLLHAVIERFSSGIETVLQHAIVDPQAPLEGLGDQLIRGYWSFVEETPELQLAQYEVAVHALRDEALRPLAELQYQRMADAVEQVLQDHPQVPDGQARRDVASYLAAVMDGLILYRVVERDPVAAARRLEVFIATLPALIEHTRRGATNGVAAG